MKSLLYTKERSLLQEGFVCVAGVDEVGAGCLAGDVYAAAVVLKPGTPLAGVQDSKRLSASAREHWDEIIRERAQIWAIGKATPREIDRINIRQASFLAMRRALDQLEGVDHVLCDGFTIPQLTVSCTRVIKGDAKIKSIAAASIIAKVARDAYMRQVAELYPEYGFERHKGYGTLIHRKAIVEHGLLDIHRRSFCKKFV